MKKKKKRIWLQKFRTAGWRSCNAW